MYVQARRLAVSSQRVEDAVDGDVVVVALAHAAEDMRRHPRAHLLVVVARARLDAHDVAVWCDALARELPCHAHIGDARLVCCVRLFRRRQRRDLRDARRIAVVDDRILAVVELVAVHRLIILGELERYLKIAVALRIDDAEGLDGLVDLAECVIVKTLRQGCALKRRCELERICLGRLGDDIAADQTVIAQRDVNLVLFRRVELHRLVELDRRRGR